MDRVSGRPLSRRLAAALLGAGLLLPIVPAQAQIRIGIKGGLSFATFSEAGNLDNKTGFAAGASLPIGFGSLFDLQPEVLFMSKGPEGQQVRFLEVPLLLRLNLPIPAVKPFGVAGPWAAFRLSCDFTGVSDCPAGIAERDYGVALGAGVRLGTGMGFTLEGRYTWGFKDINDLTAGVDEKTRTFLILAGIEF